MTTDEFLWIWFNMECSRKCKISIFVTSAFDIFRRNDSCVSRSLCDEGHFSKALAGLKHFIEHLFLSLKCLRESLNFKVHFLFFKNWVEAVFQRQLDPIFEKLKPLVLRKLFMKLNVKRLFRLINKNRIFYPKSVIFWLVVVVDLCFLDFAPQKMKC